MDSPSRKQLMFQASIEERCVELGSRRKAVEFLDEEIFYHVSSISRNMEMPGDWERIGYLLKMRKDLGEIAERGAGHHYSEREEQFYKADVDEICESLSSEDAIIFLGNEMALYLVPAVIGYGERNYQERIHYLRKIREGLLGELSLRESNQDGDKED